MTSSPAADETSLMVPALDGTLGALYIGIVAATSLWGVASLQVYYYFMRFSRDHWSLKALVVIVWVLDSIHQGMFTHAGYIYCIKQYGNVGYLTHVEASLDYIILISAITSMIVQSFLVYRVWRISHGNVLLVTFLAITVTATFCTLTAYFGKSIEASTFSNIHSREWLAKTSESLTVVSDFSIAGSLIFFLQRSRTGFDRTETIINRLIVLTVNTGLSTSVVALLTLIFLSVYPHKYIYIALFGNISKLYANSLLATLNSRNSAICYRRNQKESSQSITLSGLRDRNDRQGVDSDVRGREHIISISVTAQTTSEATSSTNSDKNFHCGEVGRTSTKNLHMV